MAHPLSGIKRSMETIIEALTENRNATLYRLQEDNLLDQFLLDTFDTHALSTIKKEFLKRDLLQLKNTPLDLVHYASLIKELKDNPELDLPGNHPLFTLELRSLFGKYGVQ